jgi:hypothetical protein
MSTFMYDAAAFLITSYAVTEQCIFWGGTAGVSALSLKANSTSIFVIFTAWSTVLPTHNSAITSEDAIAVPQPKDLNFDSTISSVVSFTAQYNLTASPHD